MALTPSNMLALGTEAPFFKLQDTVSDKMLSINDLSSEKGTVLMFICNHCPYVIHVNPEIVRIANDYQAKGVKFAAISSNDTEAHPEDAPDKMKALALEEGFTFPYLYDENQNVAKAYDAACTPDFYVFDHEMKLVYRGRIDNSRPNSGTPLSGKDLRGALDNLLEKKPISPVQFPSMGCNIKWK
jgi:thiol-disulfide isomerase/thioredoxin